MDASSMHIVQFGKCKGAGGCFRAHCGHRFSDSFFQGPHAFLSWRCPEKDAFHSASVTPWPLSLDSLPCFLPRIPAETQLLSVDFLAPDMLKQSELCSVKFGPFQTCYRAVRRIVHACWVAWISNIYVAKALKISTLQNSFLTSIGCRTSEH